MITSLGQCLWGAGRQPVARKGHQWQSPVSAQVLEARVLLTADVIMEWNAVALEVNRISYSGEVVNDQIGPTRSSRALAIVHAAMFDAWNSVNFKYTPYLVKAPCSGVASDAAAVAQAAHDTLVAMYPHQQASIDAALADTLAQVPNRTAKARGIKVGKYVAAAILKARQGDGSEVPGVYTPSGDMGYHDIDPLNPNQGFLTPAWGDVSPFAIPTSDYITTRSAPGMDTQEYADAYHQVKTIGDLTSAERTTDQTEIGIYWGYDVARGLGDPPRLYNQIARVIAEQEDNTVGENARMFALINIAMADAGIHSWGVKYRDAFWRPIVAVRNGENDPNLDTEGQTDWSPLGAPRTNPAPGEDVNFTPPFPAYVSGHATFGGAAFKTMANFYQTDDVDFSIPFDFISDEFNGVSRDIYEAIPELVIDHVREIRPRHFESFSQASAENAASRIFLGIHWRFDATEGVSAGNRIADYTFDHVMRPRRGRHPRHVPSVDFEAQIDAYLDGTYTTMFAQQSAGFAATGTVGSTAAPSGKSTTLDGFSKAMTTSLVHGGVEDARFNASLIAGATLATRRSAPTEITSPAATTTGVSALSNGIGNAMIAQQLTAKPRTSGISQRIGAFHR
ncbi:MAG: chloroperoxidase [Planctomycetaceae bacterium]